MAGYSGTPLPRKLGMAPGQRIRILDAPPAFAELLGPLPDGSVLATPDSGPIDLAIIFHVREAALAASFPTVASQLSPAGALWVSWPKRAARVATDLTENVVRAVGLKVGLVDVKVCAIDETWSGLKFVIRRRDRPAATRGA